MPSNIQNYFDANPVFKPMFLRVLSNLMGTQPSAIMSRIKNYPITGGGKIEAVAQVGFNGGFASLGSDLTAPQAGRNVYQKFVEERKRMAVSLNISDEAIKASANDQLAMQNLLKQEIESGYEVAKWNVGRMIFGNGKGILSPIASVSGNTITLPEDGKPENIKEGLIIDIYADGAQPGTAPAYEKRRITSVNLDASPITFTVDGGTMTQQKGFVTIQMSYGNEVTGLGAIFDEAIDTIYGVKKDDVPLVKPIVMSAEGDINDSIIWDVLDQAETRKGSKVDMLLMGKEAYKHYVEYLRVNNLRYEKNDLTITGGFRGIEYIYGTHPVVIVHEQFVPSNECWGFDTTSLGFYQLGDWDFISQGGSAFTLVPGTMWYNAVIAKYGNLICNKPGGCVRITNCAA